MKKKEKQVSMQDALIKDAVKQFKEGKIKNSTDVESYLDHLLQPMMQALLDAELDNHLDYEKYEHTESKDNYRNGFCKEKEVKTKYGAINVKTPRDRLGTFDPVIIEKGQTKLTGFEDKCISLYAKGMSLRDIELTLKDIYDIHINKDDISKLISTVSEEVEKWKTRKLKPFYVFTYADCLYVSIKDGVTSSKKAIYVIIGVDANGYKDILGLWIDKTESASFWTTVFTDLKDRGIEEILFMSSDGIAGFKGSLETVFPKTITQRCVVHLVRNLYALCPKKEAKDIINDYKKIYQSSGKEEAYVYLSEFEEKYKSKHPAVVKKAKEFMIHLEPLFELPAEIRKCIYTSNAVESVNSALRKVTRGKGSFPSESAVFKVLFLRLRDLKQKWNKPIQNWKVIQQQLIDLYGDRYLKYLDM